MMHYRLRTLLIVVASLVGAALGTLAFGQFVGRTPTVPEGPSFAAGLGGLVGLAFGLILLAIHRFKPLTQVTIPRYSLRTLLILVTALCLVFGYAVNWRYQRHAILTQQAARIRGFVAQYMAKRAEHSVLSYNIPTRRTLGFNRPPLPLLLLGERGYHGIAILIPQSDLVPQQVHTPGGVPLSAYYILDSQRDYKSASRLFPEASV